MAGSLLGDGVGGTAVISSCGQYRYELLRTWDDTQARVAWVMLNPSTADETADDPTIRRVVAFSRKWGFGGIAVVNLYAWRATDPAELLACADPVGPGNDDYIRRACAGRVTVAAWGARAAAARAACVMAALASCGADVRCLGLTAGGMPRHPLYLPGSKALDVFNCQFKVGGP